MPRRNVFETFAAAAQAGPYDEYPMLAEGVDPQIHLSKNDRAQPFFLTCEKNSMLVQMSGKARIFMKDSSVNYFDLVGGDHVYVPAGTPHRIVPAEASVMYRYKANNAGLEAVSFHCEACGELLLQETWDTAEEVPQTAYLRITRSFNDDATLRSCSCGTVTPPIDLADFRWGEIAEELSAQESEAAW